MSASEPIAGRNARFRFRLIHVFYAMAVLGASLATCGVRGIVVAGAILAMWYAVFWGAQPAPKDEASPARRSFTLAELLVVIVIIAVLIALLLPAVRSAREAGRRMQCSNHLKQIALALHTYHEVYGSFPPAYIADASGKPMHSWRMLILPFLESSATYDQYRFDEPWDGPNNRKLFKQFETYQCPSQGLRSGDTTTSYFAVIGPNTAWPGAESRKLNEFPNPSTTILVVEGPRKNVVWSEPRDLSLEEAIALLNDPLEQGGNHNNDDGFFYSRIDGRNCALIDGAVRWVPPVLPREIAGRLLSIGGAVTAEELDNLPAHYPRRLKWGNIMRLTILICLAALPLPWAIARQRSSPKLSRETSLR
jgi:prepilin-type N-terminal cleavage/methylation domain-containing protein